MGKKKNQKSKISDQQEVKHQQNNDIDRERPQEVPEQDILLEKQETEFSFKNIVQDENSDLKIPQVEMKEDNISQNGKQSDPELYSNAQEQDLRKHNSEKNPSLISSKRQSINGCEYLAEYQEEIQKQQFRNDRFEEERIRQIEQYQIILQKAKSLKLQQKLEEENITVNNQNRSDSFEETRKEEIEKYQQILKAKSQYIQQKIVDEQQQNELKKNSSSKEKLNQNGEIQKETQVDNKADDTKVEIKNENIEKEIKKEEDTYSKIIFQGNSLKEQGNAVFKIGKFHEAIQLYKDALSVVHPEVFRQAPIEKIHEMIKLNNILLNNLRYSIQISLCYYNVNDYQLSIQFAQQVLLTDNKNFKSYFRMALAYRELSDFERSFASIKQARILNASTDVNQQFMDIQSLYKKYLDDNKQREKEVYAKMMNQKKNEPSVSQPQINEQKNIDIQKESKKSASQLLIQPDYSLYVGIPSIIYILASTKYLISRNQASKGLAGIGGATFFKKQWHRLLFSSLCGLASFTYINKFLKQ